MGDATMQGVARALRNLPWTGMIGVQLATNPTTEDLLTWIGCFRDELIRAAHDADRDREDLRQLRADVDGLRRILGCD